MTMGIGLTTAPWTEQRTAAQKRYHEVVERLAPGTPLNGSTNIGWVSGELFGRVIAGLGADAAQDITPALILKGLTTIRKDDLGGLTLPLTFKPGQLIYGPYTCAFPMVLTDQGWIAPQGNRYKCW